MTDGYQVYHTYEKQRQGEMKVAGCWVHARRKFAEITKSLKPEDAKAMLAADAIKRIQAIYHEDNMMKDASAEERLKHRETSVKPLVDAYFAWIDAPDLTLGMDKSSKLYKAIQYSRNQEAFLRVFLTDGAIPLDNNDAERSIRTFCVGFSSAALSGRLILSSHPCGLPFTIKKPQNGGDGCRREENADN